MKSFAAVIVCGALATLATPAHAQATRTWVSGVGSDANPCSRTAPCQTFAGAIVKTFINGQINCLDPGGYGAVTITKSITINCEETLGSILASSTTGVVINIAPSVNDPHQSVRLRNITITGTGASGTVGTRTGINGVRIDQATTVFLEKVTIANFTQKGVLDRRITAGSKLFITDSIIRENGAGATGGGIVLQPTSGAGSITAAITRTRVEGNVFGIVGDLTTSTGGINMTIADSMSAGNSQDGVLAVTAGATAGIAIMMKDTQSVNNTIGVRAVGTNATVRIDGVTTTGNGTGLAASGGGAVLSAGNNSNHANGVNGAPTGPAAFQ